MVENKEQRNNKEPQSKIKIPLERSETQASPLLKPNEVEFKQKIQ